MKWLKFGVFVLILFIFFYFRLTPIINQTVPYTYDQGRDFLKAEQIIREKHLPFIGPTTGIQGVYHGAWWYYFLLTPYLVFKGWPQGFFLFLLSANFITNLLFYLFLNSSFGFILAIFFLMTVSVSPYLMRNAFFVSNDMLTPIFVLVLIFSLYKLFEKNENKYFLLVGLSLGFILETEVAFGIFLIPVSLIALIIFKQFKNIKRFLFFLSGILLPMLPRLMFEVKNNFIQTKAFISNLILNKESHPLLFRAVFYERSRIFIQFWKDLFFENNFIISLVVFFFVIYFYFFNRKSLNGTIKKTFVLFLFLIVSLLFTFSLFYQGSFFWGYYFQGIQYFYLTILIISVYGIIKNKKTAFLAYFLVLIFLLINLFAFIKNSNQKTIPLLGLRADDKIVRYFVEKSDNQYFCLRIYTPPVIPFTYYYLFSYYANHQKIKYPRQEFTNNQCYFIFDKEPYQFRVNDWRSKNIPINSELNQIIRYENGTSIELWTLTKN